MFDLASDVNDDGVIDQADEEAEESGLGELMLAAADDDVPAGEDDYQYVELKLPAGVGTSWLDFEADKFRVWSDVDPVWRFEIHPGSVDSPNFDHSVTSPPSSIYIEALPQGIPTPETRREISLYWQGNGVPILALRRKHSFTRTPVHGRRPTPNG